jgi:hypothetical protein
MWCIGTGELCL